MEPSIEFAPWDGRRVPVTLLGGYLGSGKTTIINELLARTDRPIAVLVNDVGQVNIDASLIARRHGDTIELTDGCVCCSLSQGLAEAFVNLRQRQSPPDQVILELSGVAEPARVIPFADSDGFRLDGVIVLIDADQFLELVEHQTVGPLVVAQLAGADVFVITKTDLVDRDRLSAVRAKLADLGSGQPILQPDDPMASAGFLNTGTRCPGGFAATPSPSLFDIHTTTTVPVSDPISLTNLTQMLDALDHDVLRAKAIVRDHDGVSHLVQVVGTRRTIKPLPAAEAQGTTDLVIISAKK